LAGKLGKKRRQRKYGKRTRKTAASEEAAVFGFSAKRTQSGGVKRSPASGALARGRWKSPYFT
jgi:hypothetical protein